MGYRSAPGNLSRPVAVAVSVRLAGTSWADGQCDGSADPVDVAVVFAVGRMVLSMFRLLPLAVAAIGCERNADAFEGFSRSNNYFFQRPVITVLCGLALYAIGWVGYLIVFWWLLAGCIGCAMPSYPGPD